MKELTEEQQQYLLDSYYLLVTIEDMIRNHNKMIAPSASDGDIVSSSLLLNHNLILLSLKRVLKSPVTEQIMELAEEKDQSEGKVYN